MNKISRKLAVTGAAFAFLCVAFGAFGAHALKGHLSPYGVGIFNTAVDYQMFHSLAILFLAALVPHLSDESRNKMLYVFYCFVFGLLFFCGSLYALAITEIRWLGAITPIGGVAFLVGFGS